MSCEYRRRKFLGLLVSSGDVGTPAEDPGAQVAALERIYQQSVRRSSGRRTRAIRTRQPRIPSVPA